MITIANNNILGGFRFQVELDGLQVAGFSEVQGIQAETNVEEYHEGGLNHFAHYFPTTTRYPPLELKRGISDSVNAKELWDWYQGVISGNKIKHRSGSVILKNIYDFEVCRWNFFSAIPVSWTGPQLNSAKSEVAIETLKLVHEGLKLVHGGPPGKFNSDDVIGLGGFFD